jgi:hypothetical protein
LRVVGFISSVLALVSDSELAFLRRIADFWTTFVPFAFAEAVLGVQLGNGVKFDDQGDDQGQVEAAFFDNSFYRTSDPRDSVFALREIIPGLANLKLDYANTTTPEHVFSIATESVLRNTPGGLRKLSRLVLPSGLAPTPFMGFRFHSR